MTEPGMGLELFRQAEGREALNAPAAAQTRTHQGLIGSSPGAAAVANRFGFEDLHSNPHWQPMLAVFGYGIASQFDWAVTTGVIETYEHRETLRFLHIDGLTHECLNQSCEVISCETALHHAFQARIPSAAGTGSSNTRTASISGPDEQPSLTPGTELCLNSFLRAIDDATEYPAQDFSFSDQVTSPSPEAARSTSMLGNLHGFLKPVLQSRLATLLRAKSSPARNAGGLSPDPLSSEVNFASFTRRPSAL